MQKDLKKLLNGNNPNVPPLLFRLANARSPKTSSKTKNLSSNTKTLTRNCKAPCSSNASPMKIAINGDDGPNGQRDERNGQDHGQRKEQDQRLAVPKLYEDLLHREGKNAADE